MRPTKKREWHGLLVHNGETFSLSFLLMFTSNTIDSHVFSCCLIFFKYFWYIFALSLSFIPQSNCVPFFGWDSPIEHGLKTAPLWKDVILQVTTPCYLHVTVQQKRGKRCLGAQIVNDFWMGKVGTCIPTNSKHLDFLRFHSIYFWCHHLNFSNDMDGIYGHHIDTCSFEAVYGAYAFLECNPRPNQMRTQIRR